MSGNKDLLKVAGNSEVHRKRNKQKKKDDSVKTNFEEPWQTDIIVQEIEEKEVKGKEMKSEIERQDFLKRKRGHFQEMWKTCCIIEIKDIKKNL